MWTYDFQKLHFSLVPKTVVAENTVDIHECFFSYYGTIWPICAESAVKPQPTNQPCLVTLPTESPMI